MKAELFEEMTRLEKKHWWFVGRTAMVQEMVRELVPPASSNLLVDVGCGTGLLAGTLSEEYDVIGLDPSRDAVSLARQRYPSVRFLEGTLSSSLSVDTHRNARIFLLLDVLEHVRDDGALLRELVLGASPGACVIITVPADPSLFGPHDVAHKHFRRYDKTSLRALWSDLPVDMRLLSFFVSHVYPLVKMARRLSKWRGQGWGTHGTDLVIPARIVNNVLIRLSRAEGKRMQSLLRGENVAPYRHGVSLLAVLKVRGQSNAGTNNENTR